MGACPLFAPQNSVFAGCCLQVTGPLAATTEFNEPPGPVPPADASEQDLAALQAQSWSAASLSVAGIKVQGIKGRVQGYSSCSFRVEFTPRVAGEQAQRRQGCAAPACACSMHTRIPALGGACIDFTNRRAAGACATPVNLSPCRCTAAGPVEVPVLVSFSAPGFKGLTIPPIALTLTATGRDLPVSTLTPVVDFR